MCFTSEYELICSVNTVTPLYSTYQCNQHQSGRAIQYWPDMTVSYIDKLWCNCSSKLESDLSEHLPYTSLVFILCFGNICHENRYITTAIKIFPLRHGQHPYAIWLYLPYLWCCSFLTLKGLCGVRADPAIFQRMMSSVLKTLENNNINRVNRDKSHMDGDSGNSSNSWY